ncbi:hypothetical protein UZ36_03920 [Candidatus Nitromaritima sp. SCGC AAA799-C22]|nr:hypothetical protein UZ36_03920 [Candidatus Nitromaritima sp. SCGC AAA799-C22]
MVAKRTSTRRGDIVHINLNPTAGSEQSGGRYAIVISGDAYNKKTSLRIVCPITTKVKGYPFEVRIDTDKIHGCILVDQIRCLDLKARKARINDTAPGEVMDEVQGKLSALLL